MAENIVRTQIVLRHDITQNWVNRNPILNKAEAGVEFTQDNKIKLKIGNGIDTWRNLPYFGGESESLEELYAIIQKIENTYETKKYDVIEVPEGTLVNYSDAEIRVMCPVDAEFFADATGHANMGLKVYAPSNAVNLKKGDQGVIIDTMLGLDGVDEYGRKYSMTWLPLATYDSITHSWTYHGKESSVKGYIGWDCAFEWYDEKGTKIGYDNIRVNLSNESCHYNNEPYYMGSINIDKLSQTENQFLELYGGSATDNITLEG